MADVDVLVECAPRVDVVGPSCHNVALYPIDNAQYANNLRAHYVDAQAHNDPHIRSGDAQAPDDLCPYVLDSCAQDVDPLANKNTLPPLCDDQQSFPASIASLVSASFDEFKL